MKILLFVFCVTLGLSLSAQEFYKKEVIETSIFDSTNATALKYDLFIVDKASFQKLWKKEMSHFSNETYESNEFQSKMEGVVIPSISKEPFTTFLNVTSTEQGIELIFAIKDSVKFIDLNTSPYKEDIETYFEKTIKTTYVDKLHDKLKAESANLDAIDNDIKKNYKEIAKNDKLILKLESEIENTQKQIENHDSQYDALLNSIEESKRELAQTDKNDENYKVIKKEVKNLEKNKKSMESDHLNQKELVYDDEAKIVATRNEIVALKAAIANLEERKLEQKQIILEIEEEIYTLSKP
jgi:DNA repair exonuclease SbcCD ATPase subunit